MSATVRGISVEGRSGSIDKDGVREFELVYLVHTDDKKDGPATVRVAAGIPSIGDTYSAGNESDVYAVCIEKSVEQTESPYDWRVRIRYTTDPGATTPTSLVGDNPLDAPAELSFGFEKRRIIIPGRFNNPIGPPSDKKYDAGIYAPNGELFDPQPEADVHDPVWHIRKNVASISYAAFMALADCVNADTFNGAEPRQLQFRPPTAERKWHKAIGYYWTVNYSLAYRWETWDLQILNQGTYYYPSGTPAAWWGSTELRHVQVDKQFNVVPVNLTTDGDINTGATPTFTRIRFFREIVFGSLALL